jgi:starvation-inducible DNA-binding protein
MDLQRRGRPRRTIGSALLAKVDPNDRTVAVRPRATGGLAMARATAPTSTSRNGRGSSRDNRTSPTPSPQPRLGQKGREVQPFGTLRQLPIGLAAQAREESAEILNRILADTSILYAMYKKHHWNVAGPTFYQLHLLFDKHAEEQLEIIDLLAERVQTLGAISVGDPRHAAELTRIERPPNGSEDVPVMISRLLDAHETIIEAVRDGIDATEKNKDWGSNDILMSDVLRRNELQVWFLSEHLVDVPLVDEGTTTSR